MRYLLPADRYDVAHPLIGRAYAVYTPMIDHMVATIGNWIDEQRPGGYIFGPSRMGKSRGVKWFMREVLRERFGETIPLVIWSRPDTQPTEAEFWHKLLMAADFEFVNPSKPLRKSESAYLFTMHLIALAKTAKRNHVVLVIDEAQELTFKEWKWLVGLHNALDWQEIRLTLISIGSHQMGYRHELMSVSGNAHVAARFMACYAQFHGIRSLPELKYVLRGYDEASEWPPESGCSYLAYYAREHFQSGKRLAHCATELWQALLELLPDKIKKRSAEFPMQHICWAIENTLFKLALGRAWEEVTSYAAWVDELAKVDLPLHLRIIR